jgi:hypothetical protein
MTVEDVPSPFTVRLDDAGLWAEFSTAHGTLNEMIITKHGRCLFPLLKVHISLASNHDARLHEHPIHYDIGLTMCPVDDFRWRFDGAWRPQRTALGHPPQSDDVGVYYVARSVPLLDLLQSTSSSTPYPSQAKSKQAGSPSILVSFAKVKLSNDGPSNNSPHVLRLMSFRCYEPVVVLRSHSSHPSFLHALPQCRFVAVTHYQSERICALKKSHNPHARGFLTQQQQGPNIQNMINNKTPRENEAGQNEEDDALELDVRDFQAVYWLHAMRHRRR